MDRVLRNTGATLQVTFSSDETPLEATGVVNVTITDDAGNVLVNNQPATNDPAVGLYTYTLPPQATLKKLTAVWVGTFAGQQQSLSTRAEVVGSRIFSYAELRAFDASLTAAKYSTAKVEEARVQVEDEFEEICGRAFITRWGQTLTVGGGSATLRRLEHYDVRSILRATVGGVALDGGTIAGLSLDQGVGQRSYAPRLTRAAGVWTELARVVVDYEYGLFELDQAVKDAAMLRARTRLNAEISGVPANTTRFDTPEGTTVDLERPTVDGTGIADVDAVLQRYMTGDSLAHKRRLASVAAVTGTA